MNHTRTNDLSDQHRNVWRGGGRALALFAAGALLLGQATQPTLADELNVAFGDHLDLTYSFQDPMPHEHDGVIVGHPLNGNGSVTLEQFAEWINHGGFFDSGWGDEPVGFLIGADIINESHVATTGTVILESYSQLYNTGTVYIGADDLSQGHVTIQTDALWENTGRDNHIDFTVANGTLNIHGTLLNSTNAAIGSGKDTSATVTVQGEFAYWDQGGSIDVVSSSGGTALLEIKDGGYVESSTGLIGFQYGPGTVTVGNAGSEHTSYWWASNLDLGAYGGDGTLIIEENGQVETGAFGLLIGREGGHGEVIIKQGGTLAVTRQPAAFISRVEIWDGSSIDLTDGGKMLIGTGDVNSVTEGTLQVGFNGLLKGTGTILGNVVAAGGVINGGHSPGTLKIIGDLDLDEGSILTIEIAGTGAGQFDQLDVTGSVNLAGQLNIVFLDGFAPTLGEAFDFNVFLNDPVLAGTFTSVTAEGLGENLGVALDFEKLASGESVSFAIAQVPEPASAALLAAGALLLARRRRCA